LVSLTSFAAAMLPAFRELFTGGGAAELESNVDSAMLADPNLDSMMSLSLRATDGTGVGELESNVDGRVPTDPHLDFTTLLSTGTAQGYANVASVGDWSFEERLHVPTQEGHSRWEAIMQIVQENIEADMRLTLSVCQSLTCKLQPLGAFGSLLQNMLNLILLSVIWVTMCGACCMLSLRLLLRVSFYFTGCSQHMPLQRCLLLIQLPPIIAMGVACGLMYFQTSLLLSLQSSRVLWVGSIVSSCMSLVMVVHINLMASSSRGEGCAEGSPWFAYWFSLYLSVAELISIVCSSFKLLNRYCFLKVRVSTSRLNSLKVIKFSKELFADLQDSASDDRPVGECCICLSQFSPRKQLLQTPCNHIMHRECLEQWFEKSSLCPLCRTDVETASV